MKRILTLTAILIFAASTANAGLVETLGIGAKETAQGKAVAAQADTPFAIYYNPAGITQIDKPTISAGALIYDAQVYSKNFKLKAAENGVKVNPDGSVTPIAKGSVINDGWETGNSTENDPIVNPSIGFAMPITDKISFGIAAYAPYGLHIESDHNPYENPISFYAWESLYARKAVTPTIAYKFSDKLSVGFGVSLGQSESDAGKTYRYNPFVMKAATNKDVQTQFTKAVAGVAGLNLNDKAQAAQAGQIVKGMAAAGIASTDSKNGELNTLQLEAQDDFNTSWNLGILYKPTEKLSLGLTYRSRAAGDFEGDVLFKGTKVGSVTMDYDHPESVQGGIRYAFSKNLSVEFDVTWTRWSINEQQVEHITVDNTAAISGDIKTALVAGITSSRLSAAQKQNLLQAMAGMDLSSSGPITIPAAHHRDWDDKFEYHIGAEWLVTDRLSLRGGFVYDPTPVPDHTFDQGWPDTDRTNYSLGMGYKINDSWQIDAVLQYIKSTPARDISGNSHELNHGYSSAAVAGVDKLDLEGNPIETEVHLEENDGVLFGGGLTVTYKF